MTRDFMESMLSSMPAGADPDLQMQMLELQPQPSQASMMSPDSLFSTTPFASPPSSTPSHSRNMTPMGQTIGIPPPPVGIPPPSTSLSAPLPSGHQPSPISTHSSPLTTRTSDASPTSDLRTRLAQVDPSTDPLFLRLASQARAPPKGSSTGRTSTESDGPAAGGEPYPLDPSYDPKALRASGETRKRAQAFRTYMERRYALMGEMLAAAGAEGEGNPWDLVDVVRWRETKSRAPRNMHRLKHYEKRLNTTQEISDWWHARLAQRYLEAQRAAAPPPPAPEPAPAPAAPPPAVSISAPLPIMEDQVLVPISVSTSGRTPGNPPSVTSDGSPSKSASRSSPLKDSPLRAPSPTRGDAPAASPSPIRTAGALSHASHSPERSARRSQESGRSSPTRPPHSAGRSSPTREDRDDSLLKRFLASAAARPEPIQAAIAGKPATEPRHRRNFSRGSEPAEPPEPRPGRIDQRLHSWAPENPASPPKPPARRSFEDDDPDRPRPMDLMDGLNNFGRAGKKVMASLGFSRALQRRPREREEDEPEAEGRRSLDSARPDTLRPPKVSKSSPSGGLAPSPAKGDRRAGTPQPPPGTRSMPLQNLLRTGTPVPSSRPVRRALQVNEFDLLPEEEEPVLGLRELEEEQARWRDPLRRGESGKEFPTVRKVGRQRSSSLDGLEYEQAERMLANSKKGTGGFLGILSKANPLVPAAAAINTLSRLGRASPEPFRGPTPSPENPRATELWPAMEAPEHPFEIPSPEPEPGLLVDIPIEPPRTYTPALPWSPRDLEELRTVVAKQGSLLLDAGILDLVADGKPAVREKVRAMAQDIEALWTQAQRVQEKTEALAALSKEAEELLARAIAEVELPPEDFSSRRQRASSATSLDGAALAAALGPRIASYGSITSFGDRAGIAPNSRPESPARSLPGLAGLGAFPALRPSESAPQSPVDRQIPVLPAAPPEPVTPELLADAVARSALRSDRLRDLALASGGALLPRALAVQKQYHDLDLAQRNLSQRIQTWSDEVTSSWLPALGAAEEELERLERGRRGGRSWEEAGFLVLSWVLAMLGNAIWAGYHAQQSGRRAMRGAAAAGYRMLRRVGVAGLVEGFAEACAAANARAADELGNVLELPGRFQD
ncbi:hypothetical protein DFJ74DRAFT_679912 [Hyaloraphidium curvatum]|nr:hypothetical protein DFJ74DRAFT_679912 [Hyaloraphidium curvatum]